MTIPYAVKEGGWLSLLILLLFAVACFYTGILMMRCLQSCPDLKTYPDIGQAAFGVAGRLGIAVSTIRLVCVSVLSRVCEYQVKSNNYVLSECRSFYTWNYL